MYFVKAMKKPVSSVIVVLSILLLFGYDYYERNVVSTFPIVESCFTPAEKCLPKIIKEIDNSQSSITIMAYSFTNPKISEALLAAKGRGVDIKILIDKGQFENNYNQARPLKKKGIKVKLDNPTGLAHNKVIIVDDKILITGSYNFSKAAEHKNAENLLFISGEGSEKVLQNYIDNFTNRYNMATY